MGQAVLLTERLRLEPLADEHLAYEVELDADPEVMRYLWGLARTPAEVAESHRERLARAQPVDGLGLWAGFRRVGAAEFAGLWMLIPPDQPGARPGEADLGLPGPPAVLAAGAMRPKVRASCSATASLISGCGASWRRRWRSTPRRGRR